MKAEFSESGPTVLERAGVEVATAWNQLKSRVEVKHINTVNSHTMLRSALLMTTLALAGLIVISRNGSPDITSPTAPPDAELSTKPSPNALMDDPRMQRWLDRLPDGSYAVLSSYGSLLREFQVDTPEGAYTRLWPSDDADLADEDNWPQAGRSVYATGLVTEKDANRKTQGRFVVLASMDIPNDFQANPGELGSEAVIAVLDESLFANMNNLRSRRFVDKDHNPVTETAPAVFPPDITWVRNAPK